MYQEDELLMLSGIQHIAFCQRQWALIHIEKQWAENLRTVEGQVLHEKADDPYFRETRGDCITTRAVPIASFELGLYGVADIIEFIKTDSAENAVTLPKKQGFWRPKVVEYKRGKPKHIDCDKVQLCAQAWCLEEMFKIKVEKGAIFYGEIRHREEVIFDEQLRNRTKYFSELMHNIFDSQITPQAVYNKGCKMCSLIDICLPQMPQKSVEGYMKKAITESLNEKTT